MSTTLVKRSLTQARADAEAFREMFAGCFDRWEIAGSVRRRKYAVSDIEHVVIPKMGEVPAEGLFAEPVTVNLLWRQAEALLEAGTLAKHVYRTEAGPQYRWGPKYRGVDFRGFNHEIFTATPDNWGAILLIRTGPADFSKNMVTRFLAGGMYRQIEGQLTHVASGEPVKVPNEETYFRMLGIPFITPEARQ